MLRHYGNAGSGQKDDGHNGTGADTGRNPGNIRGDAERRRVCWISPMMKYAEVSLACWPVIISKYREFPFPAG